MDWALHTWIPVRIEPSHILTAAECWSIAGFEDTQSGIFTSAFLFFFFFVSGRLPDLWALSWPQTCFQFIYLCIIGSAEALPILCVRYIRWEREIQREREKDGSDVTIVALKLAMSFALLLAKNVHLSIGEEFCAFPCKKICTSFSPLEWRWIHTLRCQKRCAFRKSSHSSHCQMAWLTGDRSS